MVHTKRFREFDLNFYRAFHVILRNKKPRESRACLARFVILAQTTYLNTTAFASCLIFTVFFKHFSSPLSGQIFKNTWVFCAIDVLAVLLTDYVGSKIRKHACQSFRWLDNERIKAAVAPQIILSRQGINQTRYSYSSLLNIWLRWFLGSAR